MFLRIFLGKDLKIGLVKKCVFFYLLSFILIIISRFMLAEKVCLLP